MKEKNDATLPRDCCQSTHPENNKTEDNTERRPKLSASLLTPVVLSVSVENAQRCGAYTCGHFTVNVRDNSLHEELRIVDCDVTV
jgi:hypothetical protein